MIRRHGIAVISSVLALVAIVLLAANDSHAAVYVALLAILLAFAGAAVGKRDGA